MEWFTGWLNQIAEPIGQAIASIHTGFTMICICAVSYKIGWFVGESDGKRAAILRMNCETIRRGNGTIYVEEYMEDKRWE